MFEIPKSHPGLEAYTSETFHACRSDYKSSVFDALTICAQYSTQTCDPSLLQPESGGSADPVRDCREQK